MVKTVITKQSSLMGELKIKEIDYQTAKDITIKNHYSKKWNTAFGKINFGIFKDDKLLGVAVYGNLMNPNSYLKWNDDLEKGQVIELNRMWIDDELGYNAETIFISSTIKILKKDHPNIKIIQTFADGRLGCGTIYKASSFNYYGYTKSLFFKNTKTKNVYHKVPMENSKRPKGMLSLNRMFLDGDLKPFYVKTYRYGYILDKKLRKKIKLKQLEYPKYEKGLEYIDDYKHPIGIVVRSMLYFENIKDYDYVDKCDKYLKLTYGCYNNELIKQKTNESYIWFISEYDKKDLLPKGTQMSLF